VKVAPRQFDAGHLVAPKKIPKAVAIIEESDLPPAAADVQVAGVIGGVGPATGAPGGVLGGVAPPPPPPPPVPRLPRRRPTASR